MYILTKLSTNSIESSTSIFQVFNGYLDGFNPFWNTPNTMQFQIYLFYSLNSAKALRLNSKHKSIITSIIMNIEYLPYFQYKVKWQDDIYEAFTIQYNIGNFDTDMFLTPPEKIS
jgi:hypothetical protein